MTLAPQQHVTNEESELFSLGRLAPEREEWVEEHLLLCEECRLQQQSSDDYVSVLRATLRERPAPRRSPAPMWRWATVAAAVAGLAVTGSVVAPWSGRNAGEFQEVRLLATRDVDAPRSALRAGQRPKLVLGAEGLSEGTVAVEVVDAAGKNVWAGTGEVKSGSVLVTVETELRAGQHWVRLQRGDALLREFGLQVGE